MNPTNCKRRLIFAIIPAIAAFFTACGTSPSVEGFLLLSMGNAVTALGFVFLDR